MNYLMRFLHLLIGNLGDSIAPSTLSSVTQAGATTTFCKGLGNIDDSPLGGTTTISTASAVTAAATDAYNQTDYNIKASQAYVQSLNEEQLNCLIGMLEGYNIEEPAIDENKVYKKTLDHNG